MVPRSAFRFPRSLKGITLIELLLALGMAILLVVVAFSVYSTVLNTIRAQSLRLVTQSPAAAALDVLNRDLICSMTLSGLTNAPFILDSGRDGKTATRLCFTMADSVYPDEWKHYDIIQVQYVLRSGGVTNGYSLVRQCWPFRMNLHDEPVTIHSADSDAGEEELVSNINRFQIEVFDGQEWTNQWGIEASDGIPQAARITMIIGNDVNSHTMESEVFIPAGHCIGATK